MSELDCCALVDGLVSKSMLTLATAYHVHIYHRGREATQNGLKEAIKYFVPGLGSVFFTP